MAASRATWPLARGFDRWYGFHGGETHQFVPALYHDNHSVRPPASMADGYHLTEDLADHAIEFVADLRAVDPGPAVLPVPRDRRVPFAAPAPAALARALPRAVRSGLGRLAGADVRAPAGARAWSRRRRCCRRGRTGCRPGIRSATASNARSRPGSWSASPASCRTPTSRSAGCSRSWPTPATWTTRSSSWSRTTGPARRAAPRGRSTTSAWSTSTRRRTTEMFARLAEIGGPLTHNNYPWGWTMAGNTPFRRWKREVHEGGVADPCIVSWPGGCPGRPARSAASSRTPSTSPRRWSSWPGWGARREIDGVAQTPVDGVSFAYLLGADGGRGGRAAPDPVLRDVRITRHLPRRLEGGDVPPGRAAV